MENHEDLYDMPTVDKLEGLCGALLSSWDTLHRDVAPNLVVIAFTDEMVLPTASERPTASRLRQVSALILNLADRMDDDDAD